MLKLPAISVSVRQNHSIATDRQRRRFKPFLIADPADSVRGAAGRFKIAPVWVAERDIDLAYIGERP